MGKLKSFVVKLHSILFIRKSDFFNKEWYRKEYTDINRLYRLFPYVHYALFGWKEGRNPSVAFNTEYYLTAYDDVRVANINPLYHYEKVGKSENRQTNGATHVYNLLNSSLYFDNDWYIRNYMYYTKFQAPVADFLYDKLKKNPSPVFSSKEYLYLNPDVAMHNINSLYHYLSSGKYENRIISLTEIRDYTPPIHAVEKKQNILARSENSKKLVTVLAMFSSNGKIEEYQLYLLKGLKEISDYLVIIADNPVCEEELHKLEGFCNAYQFIRHGEYDFGSYKRGYTYLMDNNILENDDNLLFINDSNYGPVYPFENVIDDFKSKQCDFYGLSVGRTKYHTSIQSFFYIFKQQVYTSKVFDTFMQSVKKELSPAHVVCNYEFKFTKLLEDNGFKYETFIPKNFMAESKNIIPTKYSHSLLSEYKYPLVKRKVLQGSTVDNIDDIMNHIKLNNGELYNIIVGRENLNSYVKEKFVDIPSKYLLLSNYAKKEQEIRKKIKTGEKVKVIFFAYSAETFAAEKVMTQMIEDSIYNVKLYIIPDLRLDEHEAVIQYKETYDLLSAKYPFALKTCDMSVKLKSQEEYNQEEDFKRENKLLTKKAKCEIKNINGILYYEENCFINHKNVMKGSDIIFFPHIQDISFSLYNPYYAVRLNILSVYIPHEIYPFQFDRNYYKMDNFNNFWKVFLDSNISFEEYRQYGQCHGINAVVTGLNSDYYCAKHESITNERKKIVVAPYFSIHNGRKMLNKYVLENYGKELFQLPVKYPNIEFIYLFSDAFDNMLLNADNAVFSQIDNIKNRLTQYSNVQILGEKNYKDILLQSDGIILDSGLLFIEGILSNIPSLYITKDKVMEKKKFNEIGYYMYEAVYEAENEDEIYSFINNVIINNKDTMKEKRSNILNTINLEYTFSRDITVYLKKLLCD